MPDLPLFILVAVILTGAVVAMVRGNLNLPNP